MKLDCAQGVTPPKEHSVSGGVRRTVYLAAVYTYAAEFTGLYRIRGSTIAVASRPGAPAPPPGRRGAELGRLAVRALPTSRSVRVRPPKRRGTKHEK